MPAENCRNSLRRFQVVILDGKAIKNVAKRLLALRGVPGGMLGGRALVALDWRTGLAVAMRVDPDGDANEVAWVCELVPRVREIIAGARLWLADRAFCDLTQPASFQETWRSLFGTLSSEGQVPPRSETTRANGPGCKRTEVHGAMGLVGRSPRFSPTGSPRDHVAQGG